MKPLKDERAFDDREGEIYIYEQMFKLDVRLPVYPIIRAVLSFINLAPAQLSPNAWRVLVGAIVLWKAVHHTDLPVRVS